MAPPDDIAPGVDFFKQLNEAGNLLPVDPSPATIASGQTPCVIDWEYTNAAQTGLLEGMIDWQVTIPSDAPPVASYYIQAINKEAPHPAAARLWQEYLFSPEGQNTWLKGFARPSCRTSSSPTGPSTRRPSPTWRRSPARPFS